MVVSTGLSAEFSHRISSTEETLQPPPVEANRPPELCLLLTPPADARAGWACPARLGEGGGTQVWSHGWPPSAEYVLGLDCHSDLLS